MNTLNAVQNMSGTYCNKSLSSKVRVVNSSLIHNKFEFFYCKLFKWINESQITIICELIKYL